MFTTSCSNNFKRAKEKYYICISNFPVMYPCCPISSESDLKSNN